MSADADAVYGGRVVTVSTVSIAGLDVALPLAVHIAGTVTHGSSPGGGALSVRGRAGYAPLPASTKAAITQLGKRTDELVSRVQDVRDETRDEAARLTKEMKDLGDRLEGAISQLDWQSRRVAQGGVRWETLGLFFVSVGLLLQAIAIPL